MQNKAAIMVVIAFWALTSINIAMADDLDPPEPKGAQMSQLTGLEPAEPSGPDGLEPSEPKGNLSELLDWLIASLLGSQTR